MPETPTQTYRTKFEKLLDEMMQSAVTKDEVKQVVDTFISYFNRLSDQVTKNKDAMTEETARLGREGAATEKRLRAYIDDKAGGLTKDQETKLNEVFAQIGFVESLIQNYDDTEVRGMIDGVRGEIPQMPEAFKPDGILKEIKDLEAKYEELDKKIATLPRGTGGGVTNMRIAQAFKYILKTEQPVGTIDGVNTTYTLSQPIFAIFALTLNGETIAQLPNYTIKHRTITFSSALPAAYSGKDFEAKYICA